MHNGPLLLEHILSYKIIDVNNVEHFFEESTHDRDFKYSDPSFYTSPIRSFREYLKILDHDETPFMMFNDTLECPQMDAISYNNDTIDLLNKEGLTVYLAENVLKYTGPRIKLNRNNLKQDLILLENNEGLLKGKFSDRARAFQLDSIQDLIQNNKLTNVTVCSPELNLEKFSSRYNNIKFKYYDIDTQVRMAEVLSHQGTFRKSKLKYKFINTNWRYEPYRHIVASYLINFNSKISWHYKMKPKHFKNAIWFDINKWNTTLRKLIILGQKKLDEVSPLKIDTMKCRPSIVYGKITDRLEIPNVKFVPNYIKPDIFADTFCAVVTESGFLDCTSYFSEKSILPMWNSTPFVIVAPPHTLKLLKSKGFKTFDKFWDESYDNEIDHEQRLKKIFKTLDYINSLDYDTLESIIKSMQPILWHNKEIVKGLANEHRSV
tara:strand:+ start:15365 stop:16666 length:1302 start_codon:yes stop_codon:yes gene_type:complete